MVVWLFGCLVVWLVWLVCVVCVVCVCVLCVLCVCVLCVFLSSSLTRDAVRARGVER